MQNFNNIFSDPVVWPFLGMSREHTGSQIVAMTSRVGGYVMVLVILNAAFLLPNKYYLFPSCIMFIKPIDGIVTNKICV